MNNVTKIVIIIAAITGLGLSGYYYYQAEFVRTIAHGVVVRDRSDSVTTDCNCTGNLARKARAEPNIASHSTITVISTGDAGTADEPVVIATLEVPKRRRVIESRGPASDESEKLIASISEPCQKLPVTKRSPIALAIRRGIERLRRIGCQATSGCFIYVQTDGEETSEQGIRKAIDGVRQLGAPSEQPVIDNADIKVVFVGLSQTIGDGKVRDNRNRVLSRSHNAARSERLQSAWRSVFTHPELISFEPFCTKD